MNETCMLKTEEKSRNFQFILNQKKQCKQFLLILYELLSTGCIKEKKEIQ